MPSNSKYRRAAKIDAAQPDIVAKLRQAGCSVQTGVDDIIVGFQGRNYWFEVKTPGGRTEKKRAAKQAELRAQWRGQIAVISSFEEAWRIINA